MTKTIVIVPQCAPRELTFDANDYHQLQAVIGGMLSCSELSDDGLSVYFHDEGLLIGLQPNLRTESNALLVGNLVICRHDAEGNITDTTPADLETARRFVAACDRPGFVDYAIPPPIIASSQTEYEAQMATRGSEGVRILGIEGTL